MIGETCSNDFSEKAFWFTGFEFVHIKGYHWSEFLISNGEVATAPSLLPVFLGSITNHVLRFCI